MGHALGVDEARARFTEKLAPFGNSRRPGWSAPRVRAFAARVLVLSFSLATVVWGCGGTNASPAGALEVAAVPRPAAVAVSAPAAAEIPAPPGPEASARPSFDEAWGWVKAQAPAEAAELSAVEPSKLVAALLDWAPPGGTITVFDRACRPHEVTRGERTLSGPANVTTTISGNTKRVHEDTVQFGFDTFFTCGGEGTYERRGGAWELVESSATGCMSTPSKHISKVTEDEVWYGGETVKVALYCASRAREVQECRGGGQRVCSVCNRLGIGVKTGHGRGGQSSIQSSTKVDGVDCTVSCPADLISEKIALYDPALAGVSLERRSDEPHPSLFRTRAACRAYARAHLVKASEVMTW